jgi:hypothetical protein
MSYPHLRVDQRNQTLDLSIAAFRKIEFEGASNSSSATSASPLVSMNGRRSPIPDAPYKNFFGADAGTAILKP